MHTPRRKRMGAFLQYYEKYLTTNGVCISLINLTQSSSLQKLRLCNTTENNPWQGDFGINLGNILTLATKEKEDRKSFESANWNGVNI